MYEDKSQFDFNGYSNNSPYYNVENKKKIGKMKDEMGGVLMIEFMGLCVRMYSVLSADLKEKKKAKGINKTVVKNHIKHSDYVNCLSNKIQYTHTMKPIRSTNHQLFTIAQNKKSLTPYDERRYLLDDSIHTWTLQNRKKLFVQSTLLIYYFILIHFSSMFHFILLKTSENLMFSDVLKVYKMEHFLEMS